MTEGFGIAPPAVVAGEARRLLGRHRGRVALATVGFLLAAGCGLVAPWAVGHLVDDVAAGGGVEVVIRAGAAMAVALVAQAVLSAWSSMYAMRTGELIFAQLRERFMATVLRIPLARVERSGTGDLVTRTSRDVQTVSEAVRFGLPDVVQLLVAVVATVVASLVVDARVSLAMLTIGLVTPVVGWYLRRSRPVWEQVGAAFSGAGVPIEANARSRRDIDLLSLGPLRRSAVDHSLRTLFLARMREVFLRTVLIPSTNLAFTIPVVVTLVWGAWLVNQGLASPGAVATVTLYVGQLARPVERLIDWVDELQQSWVSYARVLGVESDAPAEPTHEVPLAGGDLIMTGVSFAYRSGQDVLHAINLRTVPRERLVIVGPSGSGKSTLARLMAGIDQPTGGSVRMGERSLAGYPVEEIRSRIALVTQEHHVFVGTVAENLRLARADATDAELATALRTVGGDWLDDLESGLDTMVGSGYVDLTAAQAQEIALARLLLLDPEIVILDEATSMFEPNSARRSEHALSVALAGRTVIAIAHRLQTAAEADRIAVLVDGYLIEVGSHAELLARNGEYAALWQAWRD